MKEYEEKVEELRSELRTQLSTHPASLNPLPNPPVPVSLEHMAALNRDPNSYFVPVTEEIKAQYPPGVSPYIVQQPLPPPDSGAQPEKGKRDRKSKSKGKEKERDSAQQQQLAPLYQLPAEGHVPGAVTRERIGVPIPEMLLSGKASSAPDPRIAPSSSYVTPFLATHREDTRPQPPPMMTSVSGIVMPPYPNMAGPSMPMAQHRPYLHRPHQSFNGLGSSSTIITGPTEPTSPTSRRPSASRRRSTIDGHVSEGHENLGSSVRAHRTTAHRRTSNARRERGIPENETQDISFSQPPQMNPSASGPSAHPALLQHGPGSSTSLVHIPGGAQMAEVSRDSLVSSWGTVESHPQRATVANSSMASLPLRNFTRPPGASATDLPDIGNLSIVAFPIRENDEAIYDRGTTPLARPIALGGGGRRNSRSENRSMPQQQQQQQYQQQPDATPRMNESSNSLALVTYEPEEAMDVLEPLTPASHMPPNDRRRPPLRLPSTSSVASSTNGRGPHPSLGGLNGGAGGNSGNGGNGGHGLISPEESVGASLDEIVGSYGNALGLDLNGSPEPPTISAPTPIFSSRPFLRSWS